MNSAIPRLLKRLNMTNLMWTKKLSVGNDIIDSEHKNLISMANGIVDAISARDYDEIAQAFELIESWLTVHYSNEEEIARAVNFDYSRHKLAQQHQLNELRFLRDELLGRNSLWSKDIAEHFAHFLKNWIIDDHIIRLDMQMRPALQAYDYHFRPSRNDDRNEQMPAAYNNYRLAFGLAANMPC